MVSMTAVAEASGSEKQQMDRKGVIRIKERKVAIVNRD